MRNMLMFMKMGDTEDREIFNTNAKTLKAAWNEMDEEDKPSERGLISFEGSAKWMEVNRGFAKW